MVRKERSYLKPLNPGYAMMEIADRNAVRGVVVQRAGTRRRDRKHYAAPGGSKPEPGTPPS